MLESTIQKNILKYCKKCHILAFKVDSTSTVGFPDLTVIKPDGTVWFIELKTATGRLSKMQEHTINRLEENNANVAICRSLEEFKTLVNPETN